MRDGEESSEVRLAATLRPFRNIVGNGRRRAAELSRFFISQRPHNPLDRNRKLLRPLPNHKSFELSHVRLSFRPLRSDRAQRSRMAAPATAPPRAGVPPAVLDREHVRYARENQGEPSQIVRCPMSDVGRQLPASNFQLPTSAAVPPSTKSMKADPTPDSQKWEVRS